MRKIIIQNVLTRILFFVWNLKGANILDINEIYHFVEMLNS